MVLKRLFDIITSFLGILVLSPVLLLVVILIKLRTPGSIFFCQKRTGRRGKPFMLYKFRTMIPYHSGSSISVWGESRITPLGAKLRKYKVDELPELWNVLKGDMSLVGPRPVVPVYTERLKGEELRILDLRPGITSPASIRYANEEVLIASASDPHKYYNEVIWPDKVRLNLEYANNRSFFGDLIIIFDTIFKRN
ncbi:MAG: sugar transferase [Bacteroidales bacterium]|nr:sugar transferase [Bacteroidales bacterium]